MYYDVVCSVYEIGEYCDSRIDSHLICGGFDTDDEAMEYINTHNCDVYHDKRDKYIYTEIEIEEHDDNGNVVSVVTVD